MEIKRRLRPGDAINCKGARVTIRKVLFQDCYIDEYKYRGEDRSYIDIEFIDMYGMYRHWKSGLDGGSVRYLDCKDSGFNEKTINKVKECQKSLDLYSEDRDVLFIVNYFPQGKYLVFLNNMYVGYVDHATTGKDRLFYELAGFCRLEVEGEFYIACFPTKVDGLSNENLTIYCERAEFASIFSELLPKEWSIDSVISISEILSSSADYGYDYGYSKNIFRKYFYDLFLIVRELKSWFRTEPEVIINSENIIVKVRNSKGEVKIRIGKE